MSTQTTSISFDSSFVRTTPGALRIAEFLLSICAIISVSEGAYCGLHSGRYGFYHFVAISSMILTIIILIIFLFRIDKMCTVIHWPLSLLINDAILTIAYFVAAILLLISIGGCYYGKGARIAAGIFGIVGLLMFGFSAFLDFRDFRGRSTATSGPNKGEPA